MKRKYYKVLISCPHSLAERFRQWLLPHVDDMIALPCFSGAEVFERSGKTQSFECLYFYEEDQDFQTYMDEYAAKMRGDLNEELKTQLTFERYLGFERLL